MTALSAIEKLIAEAERVREYHKRRGAPGYIEAAAAAIRIRALRDAKAALEDLG